MGSRVGLEELSESLVIDLAVEGGLEAGRLEPEVEERARVPFGAGAHLAPGFLKRRAIELQVEAQVVGDGERGPLIEIGDEVRRDDGLAGVSPHRRADCPGLVVNPPGRRQAEEGDLVHLGRGRLKAKDGGKVGQGEGGSLAGEGVVAEAGRTGNLKSGGEAGVGLDRGRPPAPEVGGEGAGGLVGTGIDQENRPEGAFLGSRAELPEIVGQDVGQQLDAEGTALLAFALRFAFDGDGFSIHGSCFGRLGLPARLSGRRGSGGFVAVKGSAAGRPEGIALPAPKPPETMAAERAGRRTGGPFAVVNRSRAGGESFETSLLRMMASGVELAGACAPGCGRRTRGPEGGKLDGECHGASRVRRGGGKMIAKRRSSSTPDTGALPGARQRGGA